MTEESKGVCPSGKRVRERETKEGCNNVSDGVYGSM